MFQRISRHLFLLALLAALPGCGSQPQLGACCQGALELVAQMDDCCKSGISVAGALSGCCDPGMLPETPDDKRPDCCAAGWALLEQASSCCRNVVYTGEAHGCCAAMPEALAGLGS